MPIAVVGSPMSEDESIQPPKPEGEPEVEPEQEPEAEPLRTWRYQLAGANSFEEIARNGQRK